MVPRNSKEWFKKFESQGFRFFCVSCKRERRQAPPAKVGSALFFFHVFVACSFFTLLGWPWMGIKGFMAFVIPVGLVMESVYRLRMRAVMVCPDCKFDPILYLVDRDRAVKQVEEAWRSKFADKGIAYPVKSRGKTSVRRSLDLRDASGVSQRHVN